MITASMRSRAIVAKPRSTSSGVRTLTGKQVLPVSVRTPEEVERGFATMARERIDAVIILPDTFLLQQRAQIAGLALKHRLPSIYPLQQYAEAGGLMSY